MNFIFEYMKMIKYIMGGVNITLSIFSITFFIALPMGMMVALVYNKSGQAVKKIIDLYAWIFRGSPLLLQIIFMYFGLGVVGIKFTPFQAAIIAFSLNYGAYFVEIVRGGIESISKTQFEAFKSIGMTYYQGMKRIIMPQAIRKAMPALCNEVINLLKDTALVSVLGIGDILRNSKEIVTREFTFIPLIFAAIIYLIFSSVIIKIFKKVEKKYNYF